MKWQSGYHGEDSLRNKAQRWAKQELMGAEGGNVPASMSAPQNTKMRPFKKGGRCSGGKMAEGGKTFPAGYFSNRKSMQQSGAQMAVGGRAMSDDYRERGVRHGLNRDQTDMHIPTRSRNDASRNMPAEKAERLARGGNMRLNVESPKEFKREGMRRGGYEHEKHHYEKKHGKNHKGFGGLLGGLGGSFFGGPMGGMLGSTLGNLLPFKEGGSAHRKGHRRAEGGPVRKAGGGPFGFVNQIPEHMKSYPKAEGGQARKAADGGAFGRPMPRFGRGYNRPMLDGMMPGMGKQPRLNVPMNAMAGMAEGGSAKRHGGHMKKRASGGTVYEREMVGERPGSKAHHFNYESEMRGERAVRKPSSRHESKRGLHDMEHGQLFRDGGMAHAKRGGHKKAVGGVAKIRHNQATASGQPRGARRVIRNNLFD